MGFGPPVTPQVIKSLLIANGIVFALQLMTRGPICLLYTSDAADE